MLAAWSTAVSAFEANNVYIADVAVRLKQIVKFELYIYMIEILKVRPALNKQGKENERMLEGIVSRLNVLGFIPMK